MIVASCFPRLLVTSGLIFYLVLSAIMVVSKSMIQTQVSGSSKTRMSDSHNNEKIKDTLRMTSLLSSSNSLSTFLQQFVNNELGVNETKHLFQSTSFETRRQPGLEDQAKLLGNNLSIQFDTYVESVERLADSITHLSLSNDTLLLQKCCELNPGSVLYDGEYKAEIRRDMACWYAVSKSKTNLFVPSLFSQAMLKNSIKWPYLRWQYFISPEGIYVEYPANRQNCHINSATFDGPHPVFIPKNHPERKMWLIQKSKDDSRIHRLVFLIQLGRNPSIDVIQSMKNIVLMLLRFLDEANEVGILNIDPDDVPSEFVCGELVPVTPWSRYQMLSYLTYIEQRYKTASMEIDEDLQQESNTNPFWALNKSLEMACSNFSVPPLFPPSAATIVHLTTALHLNQSISAFPIKSPCPIFIETYLLGKVEVEEESSYKGQLQRSSSKNIWSVQVHSGAQTEPESFAIKVALKLNTKKELWSLSDILSQFFPEQSKNSSNEVDFSVPHWNPVSKEAVIVAKKYIMYNGRSLGLVAVEIPVVHFTQQISYYVNENYCDATNYAFLVDATGRVIAHPSVGESGTNEEPLSPIQIEQVELRQGFAVLKKRILSRDEPSGCQSLRRVTKNDWVTYAWSRVRGYIVVIVAFGESSGCFPDREEIILKKSSLSPKADIQHHLLMDKEYCCGKEAFSINKASLYLSPSAFSNPSTYVSPHQSIKQSMAVMAFLSDNSGLLRDQSKGLKLSVKNSIGVISNVLPIWKVQSKSSIWRKYIHKRFAAPGGGTFLLVHPGVTLRPGHVPQSTTWFRKTIAGNGKLIVTPPKINAVGTPISTITAVVKAGGFQEVPVAILGATITIGFFEKILTDLIPECEQKTSEGKERKVTIRCVLIDENGFVIYHPRLAKALHTMATLVHLTQIEALSAIDILQSGGTNTTALPLRKETCHKLSPSSPTQESLQRYYTFKIPSDGIQKIKAGEICNNYQIVPVPNTNIFLARIQDNCTSTVAFCPCSTVDNLCLNCLRVEPSDCECPCECPREPNSCSTHGFTDLPSDVEPCEFPEDTMLLDGPSCGNQSLTCDTLWTRCTDVVDANNCVGVHDCTWCEIEGFNQCTTFEQCYGFLRGLKGEFFENGKTPFVDTSAVSVDGRKRSAENLTILPILAVLGIFLIFLALVLYCYRHRALRSSFSQPDVSLLPLQESPMGSVIPQAGSSRSNSDTDGEVGPVQAVYHRRHLLGRHGHNQPIPPPRSPLGSVFTESDHGYSTMTQIEDSSEAGGGGGTIPVLYSTEPDPLQRINQPSQNTSILPTIHVPQFLGDRAEVIQS